MDYPIEFNEVSFSYPQDPEDQDPEGAVEGVTAPAGGSPLPHSAPQTPP